MNKETGFINTYWECIQGIQYKEPTGPYTPPAKTGEYAFVAGVIYAEHVWDTKQEEENNMYFREDMIALIDERGEVHGIEKDYFIPHL